MVSAKEWNQLMAAGYWQAEGRKVVKDLLFLTPAD
jgi:hypothetical protein